MRGVRRRRLLAGLVLAVLTSTAPLACGGKRDRSASRGETGFQAGPQPGPKPVAASVADLKRLSAKGKGPIYWAGRRRGVRYELTRARSYVFIRYLPKGSRIGDRGVKALTIGSLTGTKPLRRLLSMSSGNRRFVRFDLPKGGVAIHARGPSQVVYAAYPRSHLQIEVFDPPGSRATFGAVWTDPADSLTEIDPGHQGPGEPGRWRGAFGQVNSTTSAPLGRLKRVENKEEKAPVNRGLQGGGGSHDSSRLRLERVGSG